MKLLSFYLFIFLFQFANCQTDSATNKLELLGEKILNIFDFKTGRLHASILPVVSLDPASGIELGILPIFSFSPKDSLKQLYYRPSTIVGHITYSTNQWLNLRGDLASYVGKRQDGIAVSFQYLKAPEKMFVKNHVYPVEFVNFKTKAGYFYKVFPVFFLGVVSECNYGRFNDTKTLSLETELLDDATVIGLGTSLKFDTRNNELYPTKGVYTELSFLFDKTVGSNYFQSLYFDTRYYGSLSKSTVVASKVYAASIFGNAPLFVRPFLGSGNHLRGISHRFEYAANNIKYVQMELRQWLFWRVGVVAFGGVGHWSDSKLFYFDTQHIIFNYGTGLRLSLIPRDKLNGRIDFATSTTGDKGIYLSIKEVF